MSCHRSFALLPWMGRIVRTTQVFHPDETVWDARMLALVIAGIHEQEKAPGLKLDFRPFAQHNRKVMIPKFRKPGSPHLFTAAQATSWCGVSWVNAPLGQGLESLVETVADGVSNRRYVHAPTGRVAASVSIFPHQEDVAAWDHQPFPKSLGQRLRKKARLATQGHTSPS